MATLRQYFETDFSNSVRVHVTFRYLEEDIQGVLLYELSSFTAFLSCYSPGAERTYDYYIGFLKMLQYGRTKLHFAGNITLPAAKMFPGELKIYNKPDFEIGYRLFGDPTWRSTKDISATTRVFIYSEADFGPAEISKLQQEAKHLGHDLQFGHTSMADRGLNCHLPS